MANWYDSTKGTYFVDDKWIGIDYGKHLLDPLDAQLTLFHETTHSVLGITTDFGQATQNIYKLKDQFKHLVREEKDAICYPLYKAQDFVQEGFATFMEIARLKTLTNKSNALDWASKKFPDDYLEKFNKLAFALDLSPRYRDYFTQKVSKIAMETGFRRDAQKLDLLSDPKKLVNYLSDIRVNPNLRLEKMLDTLRYKNWLVTKPMPEIASACGVDYFEPPTKVEVAQFLTYLTSFTNNPHTFQESDIGDLPTSEVILKEAYDSIIVGNMNFNFGESAIALYKKEDFLFYKNQMELVFISLSEPSPDEGFNNYLRVMTGVNPEVTMGGFVKTGEKYITATSKEIAEDILNTDLKDKTLLVKWGGFNLATNKFIWATKTRHPDLIIYNRVTDLKDTISKYIEANKHSFIKYIHIGAGEDHPLQTLLVMIDDLPSMHIANAYGNKDIHLFLEQWKGRVTKMELKELVIHKQHLNNLFACWFNLGWDVDWVETMLDGKILHFRK